MQPNEGGEPIRRKKKKREEEHPHVHVHDESNWLVSYADMMTLLFGFFVLMYSFSRIDNDKFDVVRKDIVKYFGGPYIENPGALNVRRKIEAAIGQGLAGNVADKTESSNPEDIATGFGPDQFSISNSGDQIKITLESEVIFASGSSALTPESVKVIDKLASALKDEKIESLEVEGHTDSDPIKSAYFPSNWELSSSRSSRIVRRFLEHNLPAEKMRAVGLADSQPRFPEVDTATGKPLPENKKKNRRIVINVKLSPQQHASIEKLQKEGFQAPPTINPAEQSKDFASKTNAPEAPLPEDPTARLEEIQRRMEETQKRFDDANQRLQTAKDLEMKMKEVDKLAKKTAELERKIQSTEKTAEQKLIELQSKTQELEQKADAKKGDQ